MAIPTVCQPIANQLAELKGEKSALQADLKDPDLTPDMKNKLVIQIKQLTTQIAQVQKQLDSCIANNP